MKYIAILFCITLGTCAALPTSHTSVLDLLRDFEELVQEDGKVLIGKIVNVIHHVEKSVIHVKQIVPKVYEKIHQEADEVLAGLKKVVEEIQEVLGKQNVYYSFDLLNDITELTGGTKLSTVLTVLSLADKAHKVVTDAKEFVPHLEKELDKVQGMLENHVTDFAQHVLKELGISKVSQGVAVDFAKLLERVENEVHRLILDLLHKMEETFETLEKELPEAYHKVKDAVEEIRDQARELIAEIEKSLAMHSFNVLDLAGDLSGGTSLSTAFKVMSLINKFNIVVQDVRNFEPRAEVFLNHNVKKVADSAQDFLTHVAEKLITV